MTPVAKALMENTADGPVPVLNPDEGTPICPWCSEAIPPADPAPNGRHAICMFILTAGQQLAISLRILSRSARLETLTSPRNNEVPVGPVSPTQNTCMPTDGTEIDLDLLNVKLRAIRR